MDIYLSTCHNYGDFNFIYYLVNSYALVLFKHYGKEMAIIL